jgi:uncharacterized protein with HEPN domain
MSDRHRSRTPEYLQHILQAIERIGRYTAGLDVSAFLDDLKTQDAVLRNIEIIGEAARNVERADPQFVAQHPDVPWPAIYAMRNRVTHGYFEVDMEIVWQTTQTDLPHLKARIAELLETRRN